MPSHQSIPPLPSTNPAFPPFLPDLHPITNESPFTCLFGPNLPSPHPFTTTHLPNLLLIARSLTLKNTFASSHVISVIRDLNEGLSEEQVAFLCPLLKDDPSQDEIIDKMPEIELVASCGDRAIPALFQMFVECDLSDDEKNVVLETMGEIETDRARKTLLKIARDMYRKNTPEVNGFLVSALVHSGVKEEGVAIIRKMFQDKMVDEFHMGAFDDVLIEMGLPLDPNDSEVRICKHCDEPYALCQRNIREQRRRQSKEAEGLARESFERGTDFDEALHLALKAKSLYLTFDDDIIIASLTKLYRFDEALGVLRNSSMRLLIDHDEKKKQRYRDREYEILKLKEEYERNLIFTIVSQEGRAEENTISTNSTVEFPNSTTTFDSYPQQTHTSAPLVCHNKKRSKAAQYRKHHQFCPHTKASQSTQHSPCPHYHCRHRMQHNDPTAPRAYVLSQCDRTTGKWRHHAHEPFLPSCAFDGRGFVYNDSCFSLCYHDLNKPRLDSRDPRIMEGVHELIASITMRGQYVVTGGGADYRVVISERKGSVLQDKFRMKGHTDRVDCVHITPDKSQVVSTTQSCGEVRVWDIHTGELEKILYTGAFISQISTYGNELYVSLQKFPYIPVFDLNSGKWIDSFLGHANRCDIGDSNGCWGLCANERYLISGSHNHELLIWSRFTRQRLFKFNLKTTGALRFSMTDQYAAAGLQDGRVILFCLKTGARVAQFKDHTDVICSVHLQQTKFHLTLLSASMDNLVCRRRYSALESMESDPNANLMVDPPRKCMNCKRDELPKEEKFKRCGACRMVFYCSRECQLADW
eukprot:CAMPEP_0117442926 /NCGR_PEP_ID=MMETSP0759-20121206/4415_1 /TAXON_ID=63605 /ORGANISM="Percolomonas cosmopolitus, Strain WS" /LENGTH=810 /DNA_ID=CAMNT_0005234853 /DNA_START=358 /DNA_END=2787 /DNA_ORIENTATION=-